MGACGKCLGEGQFCSALVHVAIECLRSDHPLLLQTVGQVDALAVLVEPHQHRHIGGCNTADAQVHGVDQAVQAMGGVQFTTD